MSDESLIRVGFALFPDQTPLDLVGPWEVLSRVPGCACLLVAASPTPIRSASAGLTLLPTATWASCPPLDLLCVPGGPGHLAAMEDPLLLAALRYHAATCRFVTAVCTGALVLAAAGLLVGYRATTHWMSLDRLAQFGAEPVGGVRVVQDRDRITGGGVTAGIDFALTLAAVLRGPEVARRIQLQLEYCPDPPFADGNPALADPDLVAQARVLGAPYRARMAEVDLRAAARLREDG